MLVLTRKLGEKINIGDSIQIQVIDVRGKQVRLGIIAPPNLVIHRQEIFDRIKQENMDAAKELLAGDIRDLGLLINKNNKNDEKPEK